MRKFFVYISSFIILSVAIINIGTIYCPVNAEAETKIGGYTTYYYTSIQGRKHNIKLAGSKLDGVTVGPGEIFSFNETVGMRTEENGFQLANIIVSGEYKEGVGGGVCQVSTTLYNAWITSGLSVVSVTAHSLASNYIPLSRDATVSETIDLLLLNDSNGKVTIHVIADEEHIAVKLYGIPSEYEYNVVSETMEEILPSPAEVHEQFVEGLKEVEYDYINGHCGYKSRAIMERYKDGKLVDRKVIRNDLYKPINPKIIKKMPK